MGTIVSSGSTLTVQSPEGYALTADSTIASGGLFDGAGNVTGNFTLLNQGTISADTAGGTLAFAIGTLTNQGLVEANNATLTVNTGVTNTNLSGTDLIGGVWEATGTSELALMSGQIVTDDATIILNGPSSVIDGFNGSLQPIESSLLTIGTTGVLEILGDRNFSAATSLVVNGTVMLGGGELTEQGNGLTIAAGGMVEGFGTIDPNVSVVDSGSIIASGGTLDVPAATFIGGQGTLVANAGAELSLLAENSNYAQTIVNDGTVAVANAGISGKVDITGPYSGTGSFLILGGAPFTGSITTLELPGAVSANVTFDANPGRLSLDAPASFSGTIAGFGDSDELILTGISNAATATLSGQILTLTSSGGTVEQTLTLNANSMNYNSATFSVVEAGVNTIADVTVSGSQAQAPCYAAGTRIRTHRGEVQVEHLVAGDIVTTHFAGTAPVVWVGHRHVDCRRHPTPSKVWPVLVEAHAFGPRSPHHDLVLSPDHAVFIDDVLIPIKHLINKRTIRQVKMDSVTYYHVELPEHDVMLAEGLAAESYLENGDRSAFDNGGATITLHPEFGLRRWEAMGCAPLILTGTRLEAVKARLEKRARDVRSTGRRRKRAA